MKELNERSKKILLAIIQSHIDLNTPVGSFKVTKKISLGLSPATIRNTMADLEELGYISQPHTSAGRVPTERGYKYYVDTLLKEHALTINDVILHNLHKRLCSIKRDLYKLINETSKTLSFFSRFLGIATLPRTEERTLKYIKFIKYDRKNVLCILISEEGTVKNRIMSIEGVSSQRQLDRIASYLNNNFSGLTLREVREKIMSQLSQEKTICDRMIAKALMICKEMIIWEANNLFMDGLTGTSNLPDFANMKQIKEILKVIEDKQLMIKLLDQVSSSKGIQVFVGLDNIIPSMKELSMVVSTYRDKMNARGTIGIIGPTRMDYKRLIPIVDHTAKTLTQVLSEG